MVLGDTHAARTASDARPSNSRNQTHHGAARSISALLLWQGAGLLVQVLAVYMARRDHETIAQLVTTCGFGITYASALWVLTRPRLVRSVRNAAVVCLGVTTALQWHLRNPVLFKMPDEQQHLRTLNDILNSHGLFQPNPIHQVSTYYPGFEAVNVLFHQLGLPVMVASIALVLVARLALVLLLCDVTEQLTGSARAGGLAVAIYAFNPHFVSWDSQFAYQTLAYPLALAAVCLVARARRVDDPRLLLFGAGICLSCSRNHASPHQFLDRGLLCVVGCARAWPGKATSLLRGNHRRGCDRRLDGDSLVAAVGLPRWVHRGTVLEGAKPVAPRPIHQRGEIFDAAVGTDLWSTFMPQR